MATQRQTNASGDDMPRSVDKYRTKKILFLTIRTKGFPYNPHNIVSITGPHPFLPWSKIEYYRRGRKT